MSPIRSTGRRILVWTGRRCFTGTGRIELPGGEPRVIVYSITMMHLKGYSRIAILCGLDWRDADQGESQDSARLGSGARHNHRLGSFAAAPAIQPSARDAAAGLYAAAALPAVVFAVQGAARRLPSVFGAALSVASHCAKGSRSAVLGWRGVRIYTAWVGRPADAGGEQRSKRDPRVGDRHCADRLAEAGESVARLPAYCGGMRRAV